VGHGRPANPPSALYKRVTGNFTGTTDEIIQWAACKWGIDEDLVRAQAVIESYWNQSAAGDYGADASACIPGFPIGQSRDQPGQCPQSIGMLQVRYPYWGWFFPDSVSSTAYNLDAALAARRECFEGNDTWLNTVERGKDYTAGDIWGCMGMWYTGRWYVPAGIEYTTRVQDTLRDRYWTDSGFING
jgi:autotransporter family porin